MIEFAKYKGVNQSEQSQPLIAFNIIAEAAHRTAKSNKKKHALWNGESPWRESCEEGRRKK